jgi:hypothetical protein
VTTVTIQEAFEQLTLGAYRNSDPETSRLAAKDAAKPASLLRSRCFDLLRGAGLDGYTDFELVEAYKRRYGGHPQQTSLGKRRGELRDRGLVEAVVGADGKPVKRPAPSGSLAIVWRAVQT